MFAESLRRRSGAPEWVFYEGPPTANGRPGIHHVWARLFKDLYPRFHTMRGRHVARKGGWDCHGLPVEVEVEKELGIHNKHEIEAFGIGEFNRLCRESVQRYVADFESLTKRIGMWLDTDDAYWTLDNSYIESVWWLFRQMWDAGNLYEGHKVVPYCGRCGTALSSHELGQPGAYQDITDPSVYVRFPVVDRDFDLLVWTTTPWTLVSNVGAAVGPEVEYVRVRERRRARPRAGGGARRRRASVTTPRSSARSRSSDLVGLRYERPLRPPRARRSPARRVVAADFVTVDDGSGIVHLAPAFGEIDREVADTEGLPMLNPVGPAATFVDTPAGGTPWTGMFVKDADPAIIDALAAAGRLERLVDYTHSYPHCWRCGTPLIYWAKPTWFARTSAHKTEMLRENESIGWHPEHIKHGRFGDWLENNVDWALSRDRFWGTPLPVWRCDDCGHRHLRRVGGRAGRALGPRPRRPRPAPARGRRRHHRLPEVRATGRATRRAGARRVVRLRLDARGAVPLPVRARGAVRAALPRRLHLRGDRPDPRVVLFAARGQHAGVRRARPYRNVVCLALVVDKDGQKMSKSKGNVIDPWTVLDTRGADALRWNFFSAGSPWTPRRVSVEAIDESARFLVTLWNTYSFFVTYANLDGWTPGTGARCGRVDPRARPLGPLAPARHHRHGHRGPRRLRRAARRAGARALRRRPLELVRTSLAGALLERGAGSVPNGKPARRRRPEREPAPRRDAARGALHRRAPLAPFTPFMADELHRNLASRRASRSTSPTGPRSTPARATTRSRRRWSGRARSCRSACRRATTPS